jgi:regulator of protease activity HflC (stomatin/prohibitin superfamily)
MKFANRWPRDPNLQGNNKSLSILGLALLFLGYWYLAFRLERIDYSESAPALVLTIRNILTLFGPLSNYFLTPLFNFFVEIFSFRVLRHLVPIFVGWWLARQAILGMLQSFYDLPDGEAAASLLYRLSANRIGFIRPTPVSVQTFEAARQKEPLLKIGGPGRLMVFGGAALVTELNGRFHRVLGPGRHTLVRFEYPRSIVDLRPQERELSDIKITTSDGIELTTSLTITFQVSRGEKKPTRQNPFPYEEEAVRRAAYTETNQPDGSIAGWDSLPMLLTSGQLKAIVAEERLDELILSDPNGIDVHRRLQMEMERRAKAAVRQFGITIRGTRLGVLELPEPVENQRKRYWQAHWNTQRMLQKADGEVEVLESHEIARAEAEAIMLRAIAEGLQRSRRAGRDVSSRELVALRLIESLEAMAKNSGQVLSLPNRLMPQLGSLRQRVMLTSGPPEETVKEE